MEAVHDRTGGPSALKYEQHIWGDKATGTKAQIQALGIGQGRAFPGEPGGPKRYLTTFDPRGFKVDVCRHENEPDKFSATIRLPGRSGLPEYKAERFAPGVVLFRERWRDVYVGAPEALEAAGIALASQMPGQPGMRKTLVSILPGGGLPKGALHATDPDMRRPGAKVIQRKGRGTFAVYVRLPEDEELRRAKAETDRRARIEAMPRPSPLWPPGVGSLGVKKATTSGASGHLRLAWDSSASGPEGCRA